MNDEQKAREIFARLKDWYKDDPDILQDIAFYEKDLEYVLNEEKQPGYTGQTALQYAMTIDGTIRYWN